MSFLRFFQHLGRRDFFLDKKIKIGFGCEPYFQMLITELNREPGGNPGRARRCDPAFIYR